MARRKTLPKVIRPSQTLPCLALQDVLIVSDWYVLVEKHYFWPFQSIFSPLCSILAPFHHSARLFMQRNFCQRGRVPPWQKTFAKRQRVYEGFVYRQGQTMIGPGSLTNPVHNGENAIKEFSVKMCKWNFALGCISFLFQDLSNPHFQETRKERTFDQSILERKR